MKLMLAAFILVVVALSGCVEQGQGNNITTTEINNVTVHVKTLVSEINETAVDEYIQNGGKILNLNGRQMIDLDGQQKRYAGLGEKVFTIAIGQKVNRGENIVFVERNSTITFDGESETLHFWDRSGNGHNGEVIAFSRLAQGEFPLTIEVDGVKKVFQVDLENGYIEEI